MAEVKAGDLTENNGPVFDARVGADPMEQEESLDLNFMDEEVVEETVAEVEEPEVETEETKAEEEAEVEAAQVEETEAQAEEEPEAEVEEETVAEVEEPVAEPKKHMVPKERLDAVLAKQKALQKQLEELQAQNTPVENAPEPYDYDTKEAEYQEFILDGETAKATALRKEMRAAEKAEIQFEMEQKMGQTVEHSQQATVLQQAAAELESTFPVFDQHSETFNADATQEVVDLRDAFITQGYQPVDALSKAANFVIKDHGFADAAPESALAAPAVTKPVDEVAKKRANNQKKLKAAQSQPPEIPGESSSSHGEVAQDMSTLTEEEFNALPAATLKRMRGDIV
jgi:hypothetical protein|tara:strand:- start:574 stop:1599 length:1026 start_codon:yes stop_codon:yes gene_type:complete